VSERQRDQSEKVKCQNPPADKAGQVHPQQEQSKSHTHAQGHQQQAWLEPQRAVSASEAVHHQQRPTNPQGKDAVTLKLAKCHGEH
jgi:ABC-type Zn2+ transport system substrate-binding protein/surface adhesin